MKEHNVDLVVIGSGPAGQKGAIQAAKLGRSAVIVERYKDLGGACINSGTIPSKTLREAILDLTGFRQRSFYGQDYHAKDNISINDLNFRLNHVLDQEHQLLANQLSRNDVTVIRGNAAFEDPHHLIVTNSEGEPTDRLETDYVLIGTGSAPRNPNNVPFDDTTILDSSRLLRMDSLPESLLVLGGGIIGSEYASMFATLGVDVTLIDKRDRPLGLLDSEIVDHFCTTMEVHGMKLMMDRNINAIERVGDHAKVCFDDGECITGDVLLFALGRQANVRGLALEKAGLAVTDRGYISANALYQTDQRHIYAAGDVIGNPALACTSMEQGRLAVRNMFDVRTHQFPDLFPFGIFTIPEISGIGPTEDQLIEQGCRYEVGRAYYHEIARGHIAGDAQGLVKLLFSTDTRELLAVHIIGANATELIHIGQTAMYFHARLDYFIEQIFNYPTFAEGYRIAALNGLNKLKASITT